MSETVDFTASDGASLVGDLAVVDEPRAAAIICHPHPQHGGNRFNMVVQSLFDALPTAGVTSLRFDFRADFGGGVGESLDAIAAIDALTAAAPSLPVFVAGYSFGAAIALGLDDDRIAAKMLIAPPLAVMDATPAMDVPTLILTPTHDQFSPPDATERIISAWPNMTHETVESADHFLNGHTAYVAERSIAFLAPF